MLAELSPSSRAATFLAQGSPEHFVEGICDMQGPALRHHYEREIRSSAEGAVAVLQLSNEG